MKRLVLALLVVCWGCEPARIVIRAPSVVYSPSVISIEQVPDTARAVQVVLTADLAWMGRPMGRQPQPASGFIVACRDDWIYVATCEHAVTMQVPPGAVATDERIAVAGQPAEVWLLDVRRDLAVLRFRGTRWYPDAKLATAIVGQSAWAAGWVSVDATPPEYVLHTMRGTVAALSKRYIGHNAGIRRGFSGGPLLDSRGRLLGINARMHGTSFGYAVPSRYLEAIIESLPP